MGEFEISRSGTVISVDDALYTPMECHEKSEKLASEAQMAVIDGHESTALDLYAQAAEFEQLAVFSLSSPEKIRTFGVLAVSAVALWFKAKSYKKAEHCALKLLLTPHLPGFAHFQIREILVTMWALDVPKH